MITFNNIPTTQRTPGVYLEVDNSKALKGLLPNPHRVLIIGQKESTGTASALTLQQITRDGLAEGYFAPGANLTRMVNAFRRGNPNTEMWAIAVSEAAAATRASGALSVAGSATTNGTVYLMIGGVQIQTPVTSGWSAVDICSAVKSDVNANTNLCVRMSGSTGTMSVLTLSTRLFLYAVGSGEFGNYLDVRTNFYEGQTNPAGVTYVLSTLAGGTNNPTTADVWAVIDGEQYHHVVHPYTDATNLAAVEGELNTRYSPQVDLQGYAYTAAKGTFASCAAVGLSRNSPFQTIAGAYDSPTPPEEWAAAWAAQCSYNLNNDPARPVHYLTLAGVIPPSAKSASRFTRAERDLLLYDGIATWLVDANGNAVIERSITTYRTNAAGIADPSYLDIETMFTILEIRYQYKSRMVTRFILPRFKLADDSTPIAPGAKIARPKDVRSESIAVFTLLRDAGLIENLDDFITNIVVERDAVDVNRVNVLLPPDLVNQFRILAGTLQFLL
jgi:phage tail sheath gpL-like